MRTSNVLKFIAGLTAAAVLTGSMALFGYAFNVSAQSTDNVSAGTDTQPQYGISEAYGSLAVSLGSTASADAAGEDEDVYMLELSATDSETAAAEEGPDIFGMEEAEDSEVILSGSSTGGISMDISYGYRNTAKSGHKLPFSVTITNNTDEDIDGRLVIETGGSVEIGIDVFESAENSYSFEAHIPANDSAAVDGIISVAEARDTLKLMLYNGDVLAAEESTQVSVSAEGSELFIGLLSDTPEKMEYFNGISVAQTSLRARTIELDPADLPENAEELDQLDVIIISNMSMARLNEAKIAAVRSWVENGGVLLIGSGKNPQAARIFGAELDSFELDGPYTADVDMGMQYSKSGPDGAVLKLNVCNISAADGIQVMQSSDIAALTVINSSAGVTGFMAYDLCDIDEFCSQELGFSDDLLTAMLGYSRIEKLTNSAGSSRELYQRTRSFMGVESPENVSGTGIYVVFALIYLAFTGGVLYFYLRNRGLELYYHAFVVIAAFAGAFIVWIMGTGTRNEGLSLDYTAVREIHGSSVSESGYIRVFSAASDSYEITVPGRYEIYPIVRDEGPGRGRGRLEDNSAAQEAELTAVSDLTDAENSQVRLQYAYADDASTISAEGLGPFAGTMLEFAVSGDAGQLSGTGGSGLTETKDDIRADLSFYDEELTGTIVNNTEHDLEDAAVLIYGRVVKLGTIRAGESVDVADIDTEVLCAPTSDSVITARYITGIDQLDNDSDEYVTALKRAGFLSYYMQESLESFYNGIRLIGFSRGENIFEDIEADSHADVSGTLLKCVAADSSFQKGRRLWRSGLSFNPSIISGDYDTASNTSRGAVVLEYSLGNDISISTMYFTGLSPELVNERTAAFNGSMSIYNYVTGSYDSAEPDDRITGTRLNEYLSPANTVTVRYIPDETAAGSAAAFLPVPNVTGDVRQQNTGSYDY